MRKQITLFVSLSILIALIFSSTQFSIVLVEALLENSEDIQRVSVAYDPLITGYPDKNMSPYGPEVSEVYNLIKKALSYLNPDFPENPLSNIITSGDVVVLKPNLVSTSGFAKEGCTRTSVLRPLIDFSVAAGAKEVIIAEGPAQPDLENLVFGSEYSNITGLVQSLQGLYPSVNITYQNLNQDQFTWIDLGEESTFYGAYEANELFSLYNMRMDENSYYYAQDSKGYNPKGYRPGLFAIANTILKADVFINVPKMKVHHLTGVTLSMKNLIGITLSSTGNTTNEEVIKDIPHWNNSAIRSGENLTLKDSFNNDVVWRIMADLHKIVFYIDKNGILKDSKQRKYLSVVDGIIGMEGPSIYNPPAIPRTTGVIVAGEKPIAVDAVCSRIMGFNYTVLKVITNMEKLSDPNIGKANPSSIIVFGASLTEEVFGTSYVPHENYEDVRISPYEIRLRNFQSPEIILTKTSPETPREHIETKIEAYPLNQNIIASGWLSYSINESTKHIRKMTLTGKSLTENLGLLDKGTKLTYSICLQDSFLNTVWTPTIEMIIASSTYPYIEILHPKFGYCNKTFTLEVNVTKGDFDIDYVWFTINESSKTTLSAPFIKNVTLTEGTFTITSYVNDTEGQTSIAKTIVFIGPFSVFSIQWDTAVYQVTFFSNSTVSEFNFYQANKEISFKITGSSETAGFCNVTIPNKLMWCDNTEQWKITYNGDPLIFGKNFTVTEDSSSTNLYITYPHSAHTIHINSIHVISEFSLFNILPFVLVLIPIIILILRRQIKRFKKN